MSDYRVLSARGIQLRQWAMRTLVYYLTKGFVMDEELLKARNLVIRDQD